MSENVFQGSLFSSDFITDSITRLPAWDQVDQASMDLLQADLRKIFDTFPITKTPNESQTEDDLIWPTLSRLGWMDSLKQQNLAARGRDDVPDGILFPNAAAKAQANTFKEEWKRYGFGAAVVESKRWSRPLDRRSGRRGEETAPSTQMLRYLRRVEDLTTGALRWGMLTNGGRWRLYYQGARSVSEQFFELNLAAILDIPGHNEGLFRLSIVERAHWLKVFALVFRKEAFLPTPSDPRTFHQRALDEGRFYEERVANNLSDLVFAQVFPELARAIAAAAPEASLQDVREAALILLYRLLFILYAEDRDLLPVRDSRYDDYGLRDRVRGDVGQRKDRNDGFSTTAARYWTAVDDLCRAIDNGDPSIGLPPYNGGLFSRDRTPLLAAIRLGDAVMASVIDALSFERSSEGRKYINYRDLSVQQLGSIYERLLEHEVRREDGVLVVQLNIFARKGSGSYYTPDDLVMLIIRETIAPLAARPMEAFKAKIDELSNGTLPEDRRLGILKRLDPAEKLLDLKICDPAMGSGHFLVSLVDYLADQVISAMAEAEAAVPEYVSPLSDRIDAIRNTILGNADHRGWTIDATQLDDRHIIRRMVLKRCIYGVDKNAMAVELAKVSLWLHTFTVGAPLSFLDHHLRCGDSLFGSWVKDGIETVKGYGSPLMLHGPITRALRAASKMQIIEGLTDAEIAEAHRSADVFAEVSEMTTPLDQLLSLIHALGWIDLKERPERAARNAFFDDQFGDHMQIALGKSEIDARKADGALFAVALGKAKSLIADEKFLNWQVAFPGIWSDWENTSLQGGFDAVIGNPPWDRMKVQQVEWFASRRREIAMQQRASDRKRMIAALSPEDPLSMDFIKANDRADSAARMARDGGDYPMLSGGDINIYSLFVERAMKLVKSTGIVGLLTPSGIASDKTAASFFRSIATGNKLIAFLDFENKAPGRPLYFEDVNAQSKFCALIMSPSPVTGEARCAFFLQTPNDLDDPERSIKLSAADFALVNPNTGTAPIFRSKRDAELTKAVYGQLPVLVDRSVSPTRRAWPVNYSTTFHMTNESSRFRTRQELEEVELAYPIGHNRWRNAAGDWVPLYEGKMIWHFDHRAASIVVNAGNQHRPAYPVETTVAEHEDPDYVPTPQFWVLALGPARLSRPVLAFRDVTNPTDRRTMDACIIPYMYAGNTLPLIECDAEVDPGFELLCGNLNATVFDYIARQKVQKNHLSWYIVEQLPVVPPEMYKSARFGSKSAEQIVREAVIELTYTSSDTAAWAASVGYVDETGEVKSPYAWDEERRLFLMAKLDAVYFNLYGISNRDDVRHIFSSFKIIEKEQKKAYGNYRSRELCLAWISALAAGDPDAKVAL